MGLFSKSATKPKQLKETNINAVVVTEKKNKKKCI